MSMHPDEQFARRALKSAAAGYLTKESVPRELARAEPLSEYIARPVRPPSRWSDVWKAPLHDFPLRDEIVFQFLPLSKDMDVLEIGPGSGFTAFRLSRIVRHITLVDVAIQTVTDLSRELGHLFNVSFIRADVSQPGLTAALNTTFDVIFALDVFEYIENPATCLSQLAAVLRAGGRLFLSYPNVPPPKGDGVNYFNSRADLEELLKASGFARWQISALHLRGIPRLIYNALHERPLNLFRKRRTKASEGNPQTYELTWAFSQKNKLGRYKLPLHLCWLTLGILMNAAGKPFVAEPVSDSIRGQQLLIQAWK
jgi:SAM-dependent methyltransferase